jgi:hypothetical protein
MSEPDHKRIWLEPPAAENSRDEGRLWCAEKVWPEAPGDPEPTEYIRADIVKHWASQVDLQIQEREKYRVQLVQALALLKSFVSDVNAMRSSKPDDRYGLSEFSTWSVNSDNDTIAVEWPNLVITLEDTEQFLRDL